MTRAALICPGRGSYTEASLGTLPHEHPRVLAADAIRGVLGLGPLRELDGAERFSPVTHLRPANAAALIYVASVLDAEPVLAEHEVVALAGNSMGWYTALALSGALSFEDGFWLVQRMALFQEEAAAGGQVIYPVVGEDWRVDEERRALVQGMVDAHPGVVFPSIHLGGYEVLAGTDAGVALLLAELPPAKLGRTTYPFRLAQHGPYHTPLAAPASERARRELTGLTFRRPHTTLVDGRGARFTPWSTDVTELADYTLRTQVVEPYDFGASVRVVLKEYGPARVVLPGPGNTLGGVCGQVLVDLGWRGIASRDDFERAQDGPEPLLDSLRR
jgi:malonyl CoA-acyl carrier protein transacylase